MSQAPFAVRGVRFGTRLGAPYNVNHSINSKSLTFFKKIEVHFEIF